jgi:hypothetical protein
MKKEDFIMEFESPFRFPTIDDRLNESAVVYNEAGLTKFKPFGPEDLKNPINQEVYEESVAYNYINEATIKKSEVDPKDFGLPGKKKYPMPDEKHVKSAIKFFNYVSKEDEEELARNIKKKIKQYKITDISVGQKNRFSKYYKSEEKKKAVNEMYHGEANSHMEFESVLFGNADFF